MKKIFYWVVLVAILLIVLVTVGEIYGALFIADKRLYRFDSELGWAPKSNFIYDRDRSDVAGNTYRVRLTTNEYGFRQWGEPGNDSTKILFIGDSVTGDPNMSDEDAYFRRVNELLDAEVFAIGGGGYGSLQELMVLKKYVNIIDPDYFVLQFCTNDYSNNSLALESPSIVRNQKNLRPYLVNDEIVYRLPSWHWYKILYRYSHLFRYIDRRLQLYQYGLYGGYVPAESRIAKDDARMSDAWQVTNKLMKMMERSVPEKTRLVVFTCSTANQEDTERWMRLAVDTGFIPLPGVSAAVEEAEKGGVVVRAADGSHWGPQGHRIAGEALARELGRLLKAQ